MSMLGDLVPIAVAVVLGLLTYIYNRATRYNYLADRWNNLMNLNVDEPDFFDHRKTADYHTFAGKKRAKYCQHARMYWGFVEDAIRKDYSFERMLGVERFVVAYRDTIRDCISLHHVWLEDNKDRLFTYQKFRRVLKNKFAEELKQVTLGL